MFSFMVGGIQIMMVVVKREKHKTHHNDRKKEEETEETDRKKEEARDIKIEKQIKRGRSFSPKRGKTGAR